MIMQKIEIPERVTKADEIRIMRQLTEIFKGKDAYLRSLFSDRLLEYAERHMTDDLTPDVIEDLEYWHARAVDLDRQRGRLAARLSETREVLTRIAPMIEERIQTLGQRV